MPYIKVCRGEKIKPKETANGKHFSIEGSYGRNCGIFLRQVGGLCRFRELWGLAAPQMSVKDFALSCQSRWQLLYYRENSSKRNALRVLRIIAGNKRLRRLTVGANGRLTVFVPGGQEASISCHVETLVSSATLKLCFDRPLGCNEEKVANVKTANRRKI